MEKGRCKVSPDILTFMKLNQQSYLYNLIVKTFICPQENNGKIFLGHYVSFNPKWKLNQYYYNTTLSLQGYML